MSANTTRIVVSHLSKRFSVAGRPVVALNDVSFSVREGEFCVLVGPSGCGKTTLLRILAGLARQSAGEVHIAATDPSRPLTAMVFQEQSVFPWLTVEQNVGYGLQMRGVPARERRQIVREHVAKVGLTHFARAYPHQLSGGMRQRVSVARAFATDPQILLMDEPFANVDEQTRALLQEELLRIWEGTHKTVIYITHSIDEALVLGDRVLVMSARPGHVKAEVGVSLPRPRSVYALKSSAEFGALVAKVWEPLRQEVLASWQEAQAA